MPKLADGTAAYAVTNRSKRPRYVAGHRFPGLRDGRPQTVEARLTPRQHLQARSCESLDVTPADGGGDGDDVGKLTVDELRERLDAAGLPTDGRKAELLARLREHEAAGTS